MKRTILLGVLACAACVAFAEVGGRIAMGVYEGEKDMYLSLLEPEAKEKALAFFEEMKKDTTPLQLDQILERSKEQGQILLSLLAPEAKQTFLSYLEEMGKKYPQLEIEVRFLEMNRCDINDIDITPFITDIPTKDSQTISSPEEFLQYWKDNGLTNDISTIFHRLNCSWGTDLLSAPKAVTQSGSKCTIQVIFKEYIFPTTLDLCPSAVTNDTTITYDMTLVPGGWTTQEVGVALSVAPTWNLESETIDLADLTAAVIREPEWKEYPVFFPSTNVLEQSHPFRLPTFPAHIISTNLFTVRNGETALLETRSRTEKVEREDKIPILGDIPLLGRLFREKYETEQERVLLVFVTAKRFDPPANPQQK